MRALQYRAIGKPPEVVEVPKPVPGPGQVLLEVTAAGICHSDLFIMGLPEDHYVYGLPLTLGHEGAGVVAELGPGAAGVEVGDAVAVYGPWGCGRCDACLRGAENYCTRAAAAGIMPPGLGVPGAMAELMIVDDPRHLVPIGGLDPVEIVALTDAGLTPYHAISGELSHLAPGSTAVVIGAGGLGHLAIQILRALSACQVIALDVHQEKLDMAVKVGAHEALHSDADAAHKVRHLTGEVGADVVLDFVGSSATLETARTCVRIDGSIVIVGIGGGVLPAGFFSTPFGVRVRNTYWGTRPELEEIIALARTGQVSVETERFSLDEASEAYRRLGEDDIRGRAVVVP
ncbi:NAD(P)-dependent alcohol dehydrogenase [Aeromicrobium terrae]|uniref:alcohol dehydrogenase n=1 Tax=Aeromicrobium terrae TaxID=2498846 RepID=A0A5C8NDB2_9ACTN|nr:NAD(P)-dependent alcohol dehydrogenase [Aeromicrobium terrae]TXL57492.1 NAD(P)-dependent alcohol dehydrogenase [Aeromicrobium terrae]